MQQALAMPLDERRARHHALLQRIREHDVHRWCADFLGALDGAFAQRLRPRARERRQRRDPGA
jgi:trehalose-6-phosphate synthase